MKTISNLKTSSTSYICRETGEFCFRVVPGVFWRVHFRDDIEAAAKVRGIDEEQLYIVVKLAVDLDLKNMTIHGGSAFRSEFATIEKRFGYVLVRV